MSLRWKGNLIRELFTKKMDLTKEVEVKTHYLNGRYCRYIATIESLQLFENTQRLKNL